MILAGRDFFARWRAGEGIAFADSFSEPIAAHGGMSARDGAALGWIGALRRTVGQGQAR